MTTTLPFYTSEQRTTAAEFIAALIRQGIGFTSTTTRDDLEIVIKYTGAF